MNSSINLVVALKSEAYPLIEHFNLERILSDESGFPMFRSDRMKIVISGIGKENSNNAVERLAKLQDPGQVTAWLNVGIAGHRTLQVGQGFLVNRITESSTGKTWYPSFVSDFNCYAGKVTTVDQVETEFLNDSGYDMEASGFVSAACRLAPIELVHCYKIVSDNAAQPTDNLTRQIVSNLIRNHLETVENICCVLEKLVASLVSRSATESLTEPFFARWKFSVTQQILLKKLLNKSRNLNCEVTADSKCVRHCRDSRAVVKAIENELILLWKHQ